MIFSSPRTFQLWDYHVSHSRMLLRSPASAEVEKNIDIIFYGIHHLDIPTTFFGLDLEDVAVAESGGGEGLPRGTSTFRLTSGGRAYRLLAVAFKVLENDLDLLDSALGPPWSQDPREDLGRVLARSGSTNAKYSRSGSSDLTHCH